MTKKIASVFIIMEATAFYLLMTQKYINSKQKNSEIKPYNCVKEIFKRVYH